jgi:predicted O-methyltransferase YrrM
MSDERWRAVDDYLQGTVGLDDDVLKDVVKASAAAGLPLIQVPPAFGKLLQIVLRATGARRVLEIGTLGGYSSIWLARGLPAGGRLITLEVDPAHGEVARANVARAGLTDRVDVRIGSALTTLPALEREGAGPFDLIFIDADKPSYPEYFGWALRLSRPGTLIVADNVVRGGKVADAESEDPAVKGVRRFVDMVGQERRVSATVLQTVSAKAYDGFLLAIVEE